MATPTIIQAAGLPWETWPDRAVAERSRVRWKDLIGREQGTSQSLLLGIAEIPPGATLARHRHTAPEIYYVLAGAGHVEVDGQEYLATTGSAIFIPGDAMHGFNNTGAVTIIFVYVFAVDTFADLVYTFDEA